MILKLKYLYYRLLKIEWEYWGFAYQKIYVNHKLKLAYSKSDPTRNNYSMFNSIVFLLMNYKFRGMVKAPPENEIHPDYYE